MSNNANLVAQQRINDMYAQTTGPAAQYRTIQIIIVIGIVFSMVSVAGSAIGFNYDFKIFMPDYSIVTALVLALALEAGRIASIMGFFSFQDFSVRAIFGSLIIILTVLAVVLHIRGMESMAVVETNKAIKEVMTHNQQIELMKQQRADTLLSSSIKAQETVLNNGTKYDDKLMVKSMRDNTNLIADLSKKQTISDTEAKYLVAQKEQAETLQKVLTIILPIIELFAILSFFAAFLKTKAVSQPVKNIVKTNHTLQALSASKTMYQASPTQQVEEEMGKQIEAKLIEDFSAQNGVKNDPKIDQNPKSEQNTEKPHTGDLENDPKNIENLKSETNSEECEEELLEEGATSYKQQEKQKEEEMFTIDLMKYPAAYQEVIKVMFDNGDLKKNDLLVPKGEVTKKMNITNSYYEAVASDLVKNKHIVYIRGKGYMALSDLKNEVKIAK